MTDTPKVYAVVSRSHEILGIFTNSERAKAWADEHDAYLEKYPLIVGTGTECPMPPPGWYCTRGAGHDGPCAAHPLLPTPLKRFYFSVSPSKGDEVDDVDDIAVVAPDGRWVRHDDAMTAIIRLAMERHIASTKALEWMDRALRAEEALARLR